MPILLLCLCVPLRAETIRTLIAGSVKISADNPGGASISLSYVDSALILLDEDVRFFKGIELELTVPQAYLRYRGSLAIALYTGIPGTPGPGAADLDVRQISFEPIPNKIQTIYQIPLRSSHGLKASPYASIPAGPVPPQSFPILFRIMPVIKGLSPEIENMLFQLNVKPLLSDEGAVKLIPRYPPQLPGKSFTLLIDDTVIDDFSEELLLTEGEHHLLILSDDYRNESRQFIVERAKILELIIDLKDPTPLIIFEAPENALIFFDGMALEDTASPLPADPGTHQVRFQVGDYSLIKTLHVQKGRTYRVSLEVDISVNEGD
ncbi:hypothetical protein LJC14_04925 [Treponema sp. OttesenSCG-928-L16]|nr:hypothetical protein [Treponema sp. OttesenSCG-928-L16]